MTSTAYFGGSRFLVIVGEASWTVNRCAGRRESTRCVPDAAVKAQFEKRRTSLAAVVVLVAFVLRRDVSFADTATTTLAYI